MFQRVVEKCKRYRPEQQVALLRTPDVNGGDPELLSAPGARTLKIMMEYIHPRARFRFIDNFV